ncbi:DUF177 domain-containing protein [Apilactobacillus xinyiensis]|uniref:DUF177 domain-containing protein n=1 Tax=Apilactobacillus xinyiensis TaxID=2841032 RepID=UPI001C7DC035|nr:DUF177 domain-containing protein [Apilactobacillus xinyiensis]MCL0311808.1 YceD family protein [Apilactobacillus xinyiensis]MCL0318434.1 YceD family protein [Apilactobacillus xinyiensis]MCL0329493.1 YceD family protein [Apilactobacillus xinyiensis]
MKWSLNELSSYQDAPLSVTEKLDLEKDLLDRYPKYILSVDPVTVSAHVFYDSGNVIVNAKVTGKMVVPSSRSLDPVNVDLDFNINEVYVKDEYNLKKYEELGDVAFLIENQKIDFDKSVADNIILQIPMHILSPQEEEGKEMPEGSFWKVISEQEYNNPKAEDKTVDPRLAKLKDYFK